jgi:hypothetical protein
VTEISDHCYSTHLYRPLLLPFESMYNDYGGGEQSGGVTFPLIMNAIQKHLVEIPEGENEYHDIAVTRDTWGEELFFDAIHENRLQVNYRHDGVSDVSFVMMRKDVVDDLITTYEFDTYVGEGVGDHGWRNSYRKYKFSDVISDVDQVLDAVIRISQAEGWKYPRLDMVIFRLMEAPGVKNLAAMWLRHDDSYRFSNLVYVRDHVLELIMQGDRAQARELLIEHMKALFVNKFMESTRKSWIPGSQEGSQSQAYAPYRALWVSMNKVITAAEAEYEDDEEEEHDQD